MNVALRIFWVERHIHGIVKRSSIAEVTYSANGRRLAGRIGALIGLRYQLAIGPNKRATGPGRRLLGILPSRIELEIVQVIDTPQATHIRYRVRR
jgi:hypothetical protein